MSEKAEKLKCACRHSDARQCFLIRHPECGRLCDVDTDRYDEAIDDVCECACHFEDDEFYDEPWEARP